MDVTKYLDLYLAETQEHLRVLNRGLLELEKGDGAAGDALEEVFRAAHTIKGASATLGFERVADVAHELENRLDEVRAGERDVDTELVDGLLEKVDTLEQEIERAVAGPLSEQDGGAGAAASAAPASAGAPVDAAPATSEAAVDAADGGDAGAPEDAGDVTVRIRLRRDAPLKPARALILLGKLRDVVELVRSEPAESEIGDDFDGVLRAELAAPVDRQAVEAAVRSAGEVEAVVFEAAAGPGASADGGGAGARRGRIRHVRVARRHLDELGEGIGDLVMLWRRMKRLMGESVAADGAGELADRIDRRVDDLRFAALAVRMVPVAEVFDRLPRVVRDVARQLDREVDFEVEGRRIELDRSIVEEMADPLIHLLRNAIDHGIEAPEERAAAGKPERGRLLLRARRDRAGVRIDVVDDGRGVRREEVVAMAVEAGLVREAEADGLSDDEVLALLTEPGFTTAGEVTELSGRGVGLDAVAERVRALGGAVAMSSEAGEGTTFSIRLPLTFALAQALRVRVGRERYMVPLTHIAEAIELTQEEIERTQGREMVRLRGELVPLVRLQSILGLPDGGAAGAAVVAEIGDRRAVLAVDELVAREQVVIREFDAAADMLPYFSGATVLADGRPALVLDPTSVL